MKDHATREVRDIAAMALNRMEDCQVNLKRIDRLESQSRGFVDGLVWIELEKAKTYWTDEYEKALEKNCRARVSLETMLTDKDKEEKS